MCSPTHNAVSPAVLAFFTPKGSASSKHLLRFVPTLTWLGNTLRWPPFKVPLWQKRVRWQFWRFKRNWVHSWKPWVWAMSAAVRPLAFLRLYDTKTLDYVPSARVGSLLLRTDWLSEGDMRGHTDLRQVFSKEGAALPISVTNFSLTHIWLLNKIWEIVNLKINILNLKK